MKTEVTKNLQYYCNLPYGIVLRKDEEGDWVARIEELSGCTAHGKSRNDALDNLEEVQVAWIEDALSAGDVIPEPQASEGLPSGKWLQRVPRSLHRKLASLAKQEGVSLNQLATSILAEAIGRRYEPARALLHSQHAETLWSYCMPQGSSKAEWHLQQAAPSSGMNIIDVLTASVSALPSQIVETNFKVIKRASKEDLAYKA
jgi:antitoxin HicB